MADATISPVAHLAGCEHAPRGDGRSCVEWPAPDQLGRHHCLRCGCFTAASNRIHSWCQR